MKRHWAIAICLVLLSSNAFASTSAWTVGDFPAVASYSPSANATYNPADSAPTSVVITRSAKGTYSIRFKGLGKLYKGGNVQITPVDTVTGNCSLTSFKNTGGDIVITTKCYDNAGIAKDMKFSLLFTTK